MFVRGLIWCEGGCSCVGRGFLIDMPEEDAVRGDCHVGVDSGQPNIEV